MHSLRNPVCLAPLVAASLLGGCSYFSSDNEQSSNAMTIVRSPLGLKEMAEMGKGNELAAQCITFYSSYAAILKDSHPELADKYRAYVKQVSPVLILSETTLLNEKSLQQTARMTDAEQRYEANRLMLQARDRSRARAVKWGEFFKKAKPEEIKAQGDSCDDFRPVIDQVNEKLKHDPDFSGFYKKS